ncbi:MAG: hypothetical protein Q4B28_02755 [bacterium]|nr:hypothetical protein [bacterium]
MNFSKLSLFASLLPLLLCSMSYGFSLEGKSVFEVQELLEQVSQLDQSLSKSDFPFPLLHTGLERFCPAGFSSAPSSQFQELNQAWKRSFARYSDQHFRTQYHQLILLTSHLEQQDIQTYCSQKSLLYHLIQSLHQQFWKKDSTNSPSTPLPHKTTPHAPEIEHPSAPRIHIKHKLEGLTPSQQELSTLVDHTFQASLQDMFARKVLRSADLEQLDGNIFVSYRPQCEKMRGSFHLLQFKKDKSKRFKELRFVISLCPSTPQTQFIHHLRQILAHELGHYLYFFRDNQTDYFDQLCREEQSSKCQSEHFVSNYAQTNKEEDYAESFAYRYLHTLYQQKEKEF